MAPLADGLRCRRRRRARHAALRLSARPRPVAGSGRLAARRGGARTAAPVAPSGPPLSLGWFWGFGYFVAGLWWLGAAFLVEADQFAWAMPFGVLGLPAVLAFFPALGFALARLFWPPDAWRILAFAAA